ncbi:hypothetical protein E1265_11990 [Streptomyces sp. 8K308]|uniref:hypothetical protein n=1 Tax=Streptomyces sp. 8K308 TaxID=2530388 RepID=UPI00104F03E2|nr:hypothetical protein [Streptomyces sp. 8K308]TDC23708.1 hypothetical protein E1265_11990 [Streptomyces sp. 8K308]
MSAGNTGGGAPGEGDDPFAYLYRPEAGQPQAPSGPRQPSYNQVRPVGQRTYGGQQGQRGGYGYPPQQPDARYAAPETRPQGMPPAGHGGHGRRQAPEPRRNGLLIGAIAVVLAVVIGVGAAIVFSSDDGDNQAEGTETTAPPDDSGGSEGEGTDDDPTEGQTEEEAPEGALPVAELSDLQLSGIGVASDFEGARSADGSYVAVQNAPNSTISWSFEFDGDPGAYRVYIGYSVASDGQTMGFAVNGTPRQDPVEMQNYGATALGEAWYETWKQVDLVQGTNTVQLNCAASCDVLVDTLEVRENVDQ